MADLTRSENTAVNREERWLNYMPIAQWLRPPQSWTAFSRRTIARSQSMSVLGLNNCALSANAVRALLTPPDDESR
jgi:hypothetical protein